MMRAVRNLIRGDELRPVLVRAVAGSSALQFAGMVLSFLVGIQLARGLGPADYGRYGIALAIITVMGMVGALGIPKLVTREVAASLAHKDFPTLFGVLRWADKATLIASTAAGTATLVAAAVIGMRSDELGIAILLGIPSIPLLALAGVRSGAIQGMHHVVRGQVPSFLLRPFLFSLLLFILFQWKPDARPHDAMALNVATAAAALLLGQWWLRKLLPGPRPQAIVLRARAWLQSAVPMAMTDGLQMLQSQVSILLLGALALPAQVGLFRIALSIWAVAGVPAILIAVAVAPMLTRLHRQSDKRLQSVVTHCAWVQSIGVVVLSAPLFAFPKPLLALVFGQEYVGSTDALLLLLAGQIASAIFGVNAQLLNMTGHERRLTRAMAWGVVVNVAATTVLVPTTGSLGAAIGTTLSMLTWNVITWLDARRLVGIDTSILGHRKRTARA